jgi:hypothetical protein
LALAINSEAEEEELDMKDNLSKADSQAQPEEAKMKAGLAQKALHVGVKAGRLGYEAARMKAVATDAVSDTIEDGMHAAKRAVKRGRYAAEDLMDETIYQIKQHPLRCTGITLGVGFGLGAIAGWLISRKAKSCSQV